MAGTLLRAGGGILRRSTAAGLGGLAIALLVGVMSFAFTTRSAGQQQESFARYLTVPASIVELGSASTRTVSSLIPGGDAPEADTVEDASDGWLSPNALVFEASTAADEPPAIPVDLGLTRPLNESHADARQATAAIVAEAPRPPAPAEVAAATPAPAADLEPVLSPGDRITATVSFYYCQVGPLGLHPGDGGNFCGAMRDGSVVYPGAAACAYAYLGQEFRIIGDPTERVYRCADTGSAVHGLHRDIWFMSSDDGWAWQLEVGQVAEIEILP